MISGEAENVFESQMSRVWVSQLFTSFLEFSSSQEGNIDRKKEGVCFFSSMVPVPTCCHSWATSEVGRPNFLSDSTDCEAKIGSDW